MQDPLNAQVTLPGTVPPAALEPQPPPQAQLPANGDGVQPTGLTPEPPGTELQAQPQAQDAVVQNFQRMLSEREVQNYRLQQRLDQLEGMVQQQQQRPQANANPYDPNLQPNEWWDYKIQQGARLAATEANQALLAQLQQLAAQSGEQQWQVAHPDINIAEVKAFAGSRWGARQFNEQILNDAYVLMKQNNPMNQFGAVNTALNQFRNVTTSATAMRSGQQPPVQPQLSLAQMAKDWVASDGAVENQWSPEVKDAFHKAVDFERKRGNNVLQ